MKFLCRSIIHLYNRFQPDKFICNVTAISDPAPDIILQHVYEYHLVACAVPRREFSLIGS